MAHLGLRFFTPCSRKGSVTEGSVGIACAVLSTPVTEDATFDYRCPRVKLRHLRTKFVDLWSREEEGHSLERSGELERRRRTVD